MMDYPGMPKSPVDRSRCINLSICTDGENPLSGYALIRAGVRNGQLMTILLRDGKEVAQSTLPAHLLPTELAGHRQWYALRMEKSGNTIRVFIDNKLAMIYMDPQPLAGGRAVLWSENNGIMVGRVNISADRMGQYE
jgi:hypothetical protein